jgi:hypothetical protein
MDRNIKVKLVDGKLVVDAGGNNRVRTDPHATKITWHLDGEVAQGAFLPVPAQGGKQPGFEWLEPTPPDGLFGDPQISQSGNALVLEDHHHSSKTDGVWFYRLAVELDGVTYSTSGVLRINMLGDPNIINR